MHQIQSRKKIAVQLYSVDREMHHDAPGTLKALKQAGYNYVEHADYTDRKFYNLSPKDFSKLIKDCGLTLISGHTVLQPHHWNEASKDFTKEWYYTIEDAVAAGQQYIITPWLDKGFWDNEPALMHFMNVFNKCGEICKRSGIRFGYHNHDFEFSHTINDKLLYDIILKNTDADLVTQQLDVGNIYQQNISITNLLRQYPNRFSTIHLKDVTEVNERNNRYVSTALGKGNVDIQSIISQPGKIDAIEYFIVEHDNNTSIANVAESYAFVTKMMKGVASN